MSEDIFATMLLAGALVLALWTDVRLGNGAPARFLAVVTHLVAAALAVILSTNALAAVDGSRPLAVVSVLGLFFPALVYLFVSAIWVLKLVHRAAVQQ